MQPVDTDRHEGDQPDDEHGQCQGHRDMAGEGEEVGEDAQQVAEQDEEEQREDEREVGAAFGADGLGTHAEHGLVGHLGGGLEASGHHGAGAHAQPQQAERQHAGHDHHEVGLGEVHRCADRSQRGMQLKLTQCVDSAGRHYRPRMSRVGRGANRRQTLSIPAAPPSRTNTAMKMGLPPNR